MNKYPIGIILFLLLVLSTINLPAQHLARRGLLGIYPKDVTVDQALQKGLVGTRGVHVDNVNPNTTAAAMGVQPGDVLLRLNETELNNTQHLLQLLPAVRGGEPISLTVWRDGAARTLTGTMQARPAPQLPGGEVQLGEVAFEGGYLRSFLLKPAGAGPFPTIYYIQGYPCSSVEPGTSWVPIDKLFQQLVQKGYAVYLVEKPGVGESAGTPDCMEIDFPTEVAAFRTAYQDMLKHPQVDTSRIYIYGHSLGGMTAPVLAAEFQPRGVMVYGTVLYSWEDYLLKVFRKQTPLFTGDYAGAEREAQRMKAPLYDFFHNKKAPAAIGPKPADRALFYDRMNCTDDTHCTDRHYTFWQTLNDVNLADAWQKYRGHVLALYGEHDLTAVDGEAAETIAQIVNTAHPGHGTYRVVDGTDHLLVKVDSRAHKVQLINSNQLPQHAATHFNDQFAAVLDGWMQQLGSRKAEDGIGKQ